jgi:hypothetical protein
VEKTQELEQELNKLGVYLEPRCNFLVDPRPNLIGVRVEIAITDKIKFDPPKFNIITVSKRGVRTTFSDFMIVDTHSQGKKLTFLSYQQLPDGTIPPMETEKQIATSFLDLCFFQGNEAVDPNYIPAVTTQVAPNAVKEDLGWYMPARFLDSFIEAVAKVNEVFLSGLLDEAIVYGIIKK